MEGFGHDVAQKIKSAIRAKLVELDAYVDDELPDYILVMVANKKTKASMSEDLNLFLNEHTEHFTEWLHDVLNKLHSVSLESKNRRRSSSSTSERRKSTSSVVIKEEPVTENETDVTTSEILSSNTDVAAAAAVQVGDSPAAPAAAANGAAPAPDSAPAAAPAPVAATSVDEPSKEATLDVTTAEITTPVETLPADDDRQEEFLAIKAEQEKDDILGEELKEEPVPVHVEVHVAPITVQPKLENDTRPSKIEPLKKSPAAVTSQVRVHEQQKQVQTIVHTTSSPSEAPRLIRTRRPIAVSGDDQQKTASNVSTTENGVIAPRMATIKSVAPVVYDPTPSTPSSSSMTSRKRKAPASTLGAIVQRLFPQQEEEEEEEYDPRHPIIGSVASTVQVTKRRSSVPLERQANKTLLFKALEEARKSVLSTSKPSQGLYVNNDSATQLFTRSYLSTIEEQNVQSADSSPLPRDLSRVRPVRLLAPPLKSTASSSASISILRSPRLAARQMKVDHKTSIDPPPSSSMTKTSLKPQAPSVKPVALEATAAAAPTMFPAQPKLHVAKATSLSPVIHEPISIDDQDAANYYSVAEMNFKIDKQDELNELPKNSPDVDNEQYKDEQQVVEGEDEAAMECPPLQQNYAMRSSSPKFIITLDGVDAEDMFPGYENMTLEPSSDDALDLVADDEFEMEQMQNSHQQHENSTNNNSNGNCNSDNNNNNNNSMDEDTFLMEADEMDTLDDAEDLENVEAKKPKLVQERCRYWPSCRNGEDCPYWHPTTPCKTFPNCKFGQRCVYIHPPCKFDSACNRRDCPFLHAAVAGQTDATPIVTAVVSHRRPAFAHAKFGFAPIKRMSASQSAFATKLTTSSSSSTTTIPTTTTTTTTTNSIASKIRCRDFPACSNMECPFVHPKPCRYGVGCSRLNCIFSHPTLPKRDQLRWSNRSKSGVVNAPAPASRLTISERKFAAIKVAKHMPTPVAS